MSQISVREGAPSPLAHDHWLSEQLLDWAGIGAVHIRPTFFAEDLHLFTGGSIGREGKMRLPFGNGKHAPVSAKDIARVVVGILMDPQPHVANRYVVTGLRTMSMAQVAVLESLMFKDLVGLCGGGKTNCFRQSLRSRVDSRRC